MKLAASNIAWAPEARLAAYRVLAAEGFEGLEIAPGLYFAGSADPFLPGEAEVAARLAESAAAGLALCSMQALLFGVEGAALFGGPEALARLEAGMRRAIALAGRLAIPNLVFGSPRQRAVPEGMAMADALDAAAAVFARLGDAARDAGTVIAMEANPPEYGTNFLTGVDQALAFVQRFDHPGIRLILDVGALHMTGDFARLDAVVAAAAPWLSHVHMSEPHLAPAPAETGQAVAVLQALARAGYGGWVSIEMKAVAGVDAGAGIAALETAAARLAAARAAAAELPA